MSRLARDGTAEPVSRDQILRHVRGQGNIHFPCSADHEQDWQPYPVDPYSAICDDHTYSLHRPRRCCYRNHVLCMVTHTCGISMDRPGKVVNHARGQLNRENEYFPVRVRA